MSAGIFTPVAVKTCRGCLTVGEFAGFVRDCPSCRGEVVCVLPQVLLPGPDGE